MKSVEETTSLDAISARDSLDDSQVLSRLIQGGKEALTTLFMERRDHLKAMISARLDRRLIARVDASDIVQEVYVRETRGLPTFLNAPNVHPVIWLRVIAKHLVTETHRRHFRAKRSPEQEVNEGTQGDYRWINEIAESMQSVHTALAHQELVRKVFAMFSELPPQDREVLEMRHSEGLSMIQIADLLEINLEATKKRYYRAVARFRELAGGILGDVS